MTLGVLEETKETESSVLTLLFDRKVNPEFIENSPAPSPETNVLFKQFLSLP